MTNYIISSGVTSTGLTLNSGDSLNVHFGGTATRTTVNSNARIDDFGTTISSTLNRDGFAKVRPDGVSFYTTINAAGENVDPRAVSSAATVNSGGREDVGNGAVTSVTQVNSGGMAFIHQGGSVLGGLTLAGGTATISGTVAAGQPVTFIGSGGDLALFNLSDFAAVIGGFGAGDQIDLGNFAFGPRSTVSFAEAANNTSGTLTVTHGEQRAALALRGTYTTSDFTLASDGAHGTLVKFA